MTSFSFSEIQQKSHHIRANICGSRAKYREGNRCTAVKVYTINQESRYILIQGVPAVGAGNELAHLCEQYGIVEDLKPLDGYPSEDFTETYLVKFQWFPAARMAKKQLDDSAFFGGILHLCYAPEFETVEETRQKLHERRKYVRFKSGQYSNTSDQQNSANIGQDAKKHSMSELKKPNSSSQVSVNNLQPITYIWAGKEHTVYPSIEIPAKEEISPPKKSTPLIPRILARPSPNSSQKTLPIKPCDKAVERIPEESLNTASANIREKLLKVSVPNVSVSVVRKRKYNAT